MDIREEQSGDEDGICTVNEAAFEGPYEAAIVERLRDAGLIITSLVADEYGEIIGHILFFELEVTSNDHKRSIRAAGLAPMCVAPTHQGLGIGSELVRQGIEKCRENGVEAIIVVGHEHFYPRFGFDAEIAKCMESPYTGSNFMVLPLKQGVFDDFSGTVTYPDAFDL